MRTAHNPEMQCSNGREIQDKQKCYFVITEAKHETFVGKFFLLIVIGWGL